MPEIESELYGPVARVTINRPESRNALTAKAANDLIEAITQVAPEDARVIVITGRGTSFCAGADLTEYAVDESGNSGYADLAGALVRAARLIGEHPLPVVGLINGPALGGGATLALACDLRFASPSAVIGIPAARLGVVLDFSNTRRLYHIAGASVASDVLLGARILNADEAQSAGIFNRVSSSEPPEDDFNKWITEIASLAPKSQAAHKKALRALIDGIPPNPESDPELSAELSELSIEAFGSDDLQEGIAAFGARRKPEFKGR